MLEVVNVPGNARQGEAILDSSAYQGNVLYMKGVNSDGVPLLMLPYSSANASKAVYVVKKLRFEEDLSDTAAAVDLLTKGTKVIYYTEGEFITDRFSRTSGISFGRVALTPTAYARNIENYVMTTVIPNQPLYVVYKGDHRGQLTCSAVGYGDYGIIAGGSTWGTAQPFTGRTGPVPQFRLVQAWLASSLSGYSMQPYLTIRFKSNPWNGIRF